LLDLTVRLRSLARVFVFVAVFAVALNMRLRYRLTKMQNVYAAQPYILLQTRVSPKIKQDNKI
jgi:hypothetical protein